MALYVKPSMLNVIWASGGDRVFPDAVKYALGWLQEIPPRQYFNALDYKQDAFIAYINQMGIPEWDLETEYHANKSIVQGSNGVIYRCVTTGTNIDPVTDQAGRWRKIAIEEAPRDGKQYVRRNEAWQQIDSTAFAPAVHTHTMNQITGLDNALNNKLSITGAAPVLNSVSGIELTLESQTAQSNYIRGIVGTTATWAVGKRSAASNDVTLEATVHGTRLTLRSDRVESNKALFVDSNAVWHAGNLNPASFAPASHRQNWNTLDGIPATASRWPQWTEVSGRPFTRYAVTTGTLRHGGTIPIPSGFSRGNGKYIVSLLDWNPDRKTHDIAESGARVHYTTNIQVNQSNGYVTAQVNYLGTVWPASVSYMAIWFA